jgi:ferredoxin
MFELHDDGCALVRVSEVPKELENLARQAVSQCPANAISISEDTGS